MAKILRNALGRLEPSMSGRRSASGGLRGERRGDSGAPKPGRGKGPRRLLPSFLKWTAVLAIWLAVIGGAALA